VRVGTGYRSPGPDAFRPSHHLQSNRPSILVNHLKTISTRCFSRAGLLGNPSDGFGGKTISVIIKDYYADVALRPASHVKIARQFDDDLLYDSPYHLLEQIASVGYYDGTRLIKAACKRFLEFVADRFSQTCDAGFQISYSTNIPRSVGLAGSSAIVIATLRALCHYYQISLENNVLASLALSVERDELNIPAGLQDRVVQAFESTVYMDFGHLRDYSGMSGGSYEPLDCDLPRHLYVAYARRAAEPTEVVHGDLRKRFDAGDPAVRAAMQEFAELAEAGKQALLNHDSDRLNRLIDRNYDLRASICDLNPLHTAMVQRARSCGASAKFCGSGGAIIGLADEPTLEPLREQLQLLGCEVFRPKTA